MPSRAGCSPRAAAGPCAAWMVAGAFSLRPPFLRWPSGFALVSECALASVTGPSPWACFFSFLSSSCFFLSSAMFAFPLSLIQLHAAALGDAHALAVLQHLGADAGRLL